MTKLYPLLAFAIALPATALAQDASKVEQIQKDVERMRGLEFRAKVKHGSKKAGELRKMLFEDMEKEEAIKELRDQERVIKLFGLVPESFDLKEDLLSFLGDHIGGFYLPEKKELYLVDRSDQGGMMAAQAKMQDDMVMAHELHHALQDQHFGLDRWFELLEDHEDRMQAYKSLTEGEAQLIGMSYMMGNKGQREVDIKRLNQMQEMMMKMMPQQKSLPPYLQENMMFPYTQGAEFFQALKRKVGWEGIGACFNDPPTSTEQILHPEKYFGPNRDHPTEFRLASSGMKKILGGDDARELYENVMGEFNVSVLLRALGVSKGKAAKAAAGWDGDRFAGFEDKNKQTVIVWISTWDSEAEAAEFENTYRPALLKRRPNAHLERRGTEVLLVDGAQGAEEALLIRRAFRSVKVEEQWRPLPALTETPDIVDMTPEGEARAKALGMQPTKRRATSGGNSQVKIVPAEESGLWRSEDLGASFVIPEGFKAAKDPLGLDKRGVPSAYFQGPNGEHLRLISLADSVDGVSDLLAGVLDGYQVMQEKTVTLHGATTKHLVFKGSHRVDPNGEVGLSDLQAIDCGGMTLAVITTVKPAMGAAAAREVTARAVSSLWLDRAPTGNRAQPFVRDGEVFKVTVPNVLGGGAQNASSGIFHSQTDAKGAKVQIVEADATDAVAYGQRLAARIPHLGKDAKVHAAGVVQRRGMEVFELEFEMGGRRTRQLILRAGTRLWNVACSAPSDSFDGYRWQFGHVFGNFRVQPGRKYRDGAAPKKKKRQAY